MQNKPNSILIVLLGAIGDVVRAFPLVSQISERFPEAKITWAVETPSLEIVKCHPKISRVVEYKRKGGFGAYVKFIKELRQDSYDVSLDLQRHFKSGMTSFLSGASRRIGFNRANSREGNYLFQTSHIPKVDHFMDKVEQYMEFCRELGFGPSEKREHLLDSSEEEIAELEVRLKLISKEQGVEFVERERRVLFLIGSTWSSRVWELEYYSKLSELLKERFNFQCYLIGGPGDNELASVILGQSKVEILNLCGRTTLREFRTLCSVSKLGVGSDSGPLHIASGVGLKVVSIWGPTSPTRSRPFNNFDNVLVSPIGCAGCYQRVCPGLDKLCMKSVGVDHAMERVRGILV